MRKAKPKGPIVRRPIVLLACKLTDAETLEAGQELAAVIQDLEGETARQTQIKANLKSTLTALEARRSSVALKVARREEIREVRCEARLDGDELVSWRLDTGEEVGRRPARDEEKQLESESLRP